MAQKAKLVVILRLDVVVILGHGVFLPRYKYFLSEELIILARFMLMGVIFKPCRSKLNSCAHILVGLDSRCLQALYFQLVFMY